MSEHDRPDIQPPSPDSPAAVHTPVELSIDGAPALAPPPKLPPAPENVAATADDDGLPPLKPRLKKLRFLAIVVAVLLLGLVSFAFGMFMAVASDLPALEDSAQYNNAKNSVLYDDQGRTLAILTQQNRILLQPGEIPPLVKEAVISIEDKRFQTNNGIDLRGIGRAFVQDLQHNGAVQGASTIEQQFVKNALQAQSHRTVFEKLREAALAYHLTRKWSKNKIITEYLNTIYFGNGAYGIESAARTYFGQDVNHVGCGTSLANLCVSNLEPWEAALLGGIIQNPSGYDPISHPVAAKARRDQVLRNMLQQGYLTRSEYDFSVQQALPASTQIVRPHQDLVKGLNVGYFTDWAEQQVIDRYGAQRAFDGGLKIKTTLDLDLQRAAEQAVNSYLAYAGGPTASMAVIDNATGSVRAMVGGRDYDTTPFNLATQGQRQPGSSFKPFVLAEALTRGISPNSVWSSRVKTFQVPNSPEKFVVHNDNNAYSGSISLTDATAYSDNSVFAELGIKLGTRNVGAIAHRMGINTPISTNYAMTIGGLHQGVTALEMAHAYETLAHGGQRVSGTLGPSNQPVGIQTVTFPNHHKQVDRPVLKRVLSPYVASTETSMLQSVIQRGTGKAAAIGQFAAGKTGTTENYGDAWFVGWSSKYTVAVWVGYPNKLTPMTTEFNGGPVLGGTFPALIWHNFMVAAIQIDKDRAARQAAQSSSKSTSTTTDSTSSTPSVTHDSTSTSPSNSSTGAGGTSNGSPKTGGSGSGGHTSPTTPAHATPAPTPTPTPAPTPTPVTPPATSPAPSGNGGGAGAGATGGVGPAG